MAKFADYSLLVSLASGDKLLLCDASALPENQIVTVTLSTLHQFFEQAHQVGNALINGGFDLAQRQTPGTLTTITDQKYSADRWRTTRENADLQYQRNDATGESGLTSKYYGLFKKITNTGKFLFCQIVEGVNSVPLRGKSVTFQAKMKASTATTVRMAVLELQTAGTIDTIPATLVSAFGANGVDPTFGTNVAIITGAQSKSLTTSWATFSVSVTVPATSKNVIVAVWTNSQVVANTTVSVAEAGLYINDSGAEVAWLPRPMQQEVALCQRFFEKSHTLDLPPGDISSSLGVVTATSRTADQNDRWTTNFQVSKFTAPTVTLYAPGSGTSGSIRNLTGSSDLAATTGYAGQTTFYARPSANTTANNIYGWNWTAECEL